MFSPGRDFCRLPQIENTECDSVVMGNLIILRRLHIFGLSGWVIYNMFWDRIWMQGYLFRCLSHHFGILTSSKGMHKYIKDWSATLNQLIKGTQVWSLAFLNPVNNSECPKTWWIIPFSVCSTFTFAARRIPNTAGVSTWVSVIWSLARSTCLNSTLAGIWIQNPHRLFLCSYIHPSAPPSACYCQS